MTSPVLRSPRLGTTDVRHWAQIGSLVFGTIVLPEAKDVLATVRTELRKPDPGTEKEMNREDSILSAFIARTGMTDPGLARDLLAGTDWDLQAAEHTYHVWQSAMAAPSARGSSRQQAELPNGRPTTGGSEWRQQPAYVDQVTDFGPNPADHLARRDRNGSDNPSLRSTTLRTQKSLPSHAPDVIDNAINSDREPQGDVCVAAAAEPPTFVLGMEYTFKMPDTSMEEPDFAAFVEKKLVDTTMLSNLESAGRLNWWTPMCCKLLPRHTTADGNCLLHAASLGMWGFDDKELQLRKALHRVMAETKKGDSLYRRWRWQQVQQNKQMELVYSEAEWDREWQDLLNLASPQPKYVASRASIDGGSGISGSEPAKRSRSSSVGSKSSSSRHHRREEVYYKSLEEFHVFVLAHVLRRPIIVVADTVMKSSSGDALQPLPFGGVYLPLGSQPSDCHQAPLLIAYDNSHFSALMPVMGGSSVGTDCTTALVPLTDPEGNLLPLHFVVDPGDRFDWTERSDSTFQDMSADGIVTLLRNYLKIEYVEWSGPGCNGKVTSVETDLGPGKNPKKGMKAFIGIKSWTLVRKSKKLANGTLKSKTRSKESLDESSSVDSLRCTAVDGKRNAESPSEYLLCAWLLIKTVPHYDELVTHYMSDSFHAFEAENRRRNPHTIMPPDLPSSSSDLRTSSDQAFTGRGAAAPMTTYESSGKAAVPAQKVDVAAKADLVPSTEYVLSGAADVPLESQLAAVRILDLDERQRTTLVQPPRLCRNNGCSMFGTATNDYYCSRCYSNARSKQPVLSPTPAPRHTSLPAATDTVVLPQPRSSRQLLREESTANTTTGNLADDQSSHRSLSKQNSLYDNLLSEDDSSSIAHRPPSRGYIPTTFDDLSLPSTCMTPVAHSDAGCVRGPRSGVDTYLPSRERSPHRDQLLRGVALGHSSSFAGSQVAGDATACFSSSSRNGTVVESNSSLPATAAQPTRSGSLAMIQNSVSSGVQPPSRAASHQLFPSALPDSSSKQQPAMLPRASRSLSQTRLATTVSRPEPLRPAATPQHLLYPAQRSPQQRPTVGTATAVTVSRPADRPVVSSRAPAVAAVATPVLPLYYAQRQQPVDPQPSASSSWCRVKGCKQPARYDGKCVKCHQSSLSAVQYAQKLRRSFRQPPRNAANFRL